MYASPNSGAVRHRIPSICIQSAGYFDATHFAQRCNISFKVASGLALIPQYFCWSERHRLGCRSQDTNKDFSDESSEETDATPRIQLWRCLMESEYHTLGNLSKSLHLSAAALRLHLEHVMKQAQGLKKKSLNCRERRHIPPDCDASSVRLKVFPSTCPSCDWEAKSAAKRIMGVKVCKRCGSRAMSPVLLSMVCKKIQHGPGNNS
ncbi:Hypothetical protein (Fragment) [Durusdinium trenchii]|uniref:Uncharacterized protein n=1 Tax=Durusdinium trenchii TaxID=1381693 RepID=A0ABP0Q549_9DINO